MRSDSQKPFRVALLLSSLCLLLTPVGAQARERELFEHHQQRDDLRIEEEGRGGRAGIIEEFNFGASGTDIGQNEDGARLLSGRVVELKGQTLYVERNGLVVPLDLRALRITQQPQEGQQIIASYQVDRTSNIALSLAGEVDRSAD